MRRSTQMWAWLALATAVAGCQRGSEEFGPPSPTEATTAATGAAGGKPEEPADAPEEERGYNAHREIDVEPAMMNAPMAPRAEPPPMPAAADDTGAVLGSLDNAAAPADGMFAFKDANEELKPAKPVPRPRPGTASVSNEVNVNDFESDTQFAQGQKYGDMDDFKKEDAPRSALAERAAGRDSDDEGGALQQHLADRRARSDKSGLEADGRANKVTRSPSITLEPTGLDALRYVRPDKLLPRTFYFENTYLGGSAAYAERLRRLDAALGEGERSYRLVVAESQPFDPPRTDGLSLHASVDASHFDDPRRVFLQVGIQGSQRYGWRRPPIDAMLVLDQTAFAGGSRGVVDFIAAALRQLEHSDRLGVLIADGDGVEEVLPLTRLDTARQALAHRIDSLTAEQDARAETRLSEAMRRAGEVLSRASESPNTVPGTQMILIMAGAASPTAVARATETAHALTLQGAVTSIFTTAGDTLPWWQLADAGYGNWHRLAEVGPEQAFTDELAALARVVARLIRVNIRLGKGAHAVRVLGTRVLEAAEVSRVKARELAADRNLSKTMGISADRGDDDDGIQTVIPYFLGDDSHVILVELWLDEPGVVADVSLRYKDMVNLENAAARTSVLLGSRPQPEAPEQQWIARNVRGFLLGEELQRASIEVQKGAYGSASASIRRAQEYARHTNPDDWQAVEQMETMINERNVAPAVMQENLMMSGQRRIGTTLR